MEGSADKPRRPRLCAAALIMGVAAAACSRGASEPVLSSDQALRINTTRQPTTMDPGQQAWDYEATIGRNVFEPLLKPAPDLKDVQGAAAASYDLLSDGLTYTFHIRSSARWSDGQPVTAQEFVYAWKRLLDPRLAAPYADPFFDHAVAGAQDYGNVDPKNAAAVAGFLSGLGLSAPDDHTFIVKLQQPAGYFKWIAALWVAAPIRRDIVEKYGSQTWASVPSQIVGNGAFKVSEMASDHYTLVPNDFYWGGKARLRRLIAYFIADAQEGFRRYRAGDLDVTEVPLANATLVQDDPKLNKEIHRSPSLNTNWLGMNLKHGPFANQKVREAISRAIDRHALVQFIGHGQFTPMQTLIPKGMNGYRPDLGSAQSFDPVAARAALQASGVDRSALNSIHYLVPNNTEDRLRAQFIVDQIKTNLGLTWTIDPLGLKITTQRLTSGDFQVVEWGWGADYPDDQDWMDTFLNGCGNQGCPLNAEYDQLVNQADQASRQSDRQKLYDRAQAMIVNNYSVAFLYSRQTWTLVKPYVQGIRPTALDESLLPGDFFANQIYITQH